MNSNIHKTLKSLKRTWTSSFFLPVWTGFSQAIFHMSGYRMFKALRLCSKNSFSFLIFNTYEATEWALILVLWKTRRWICMVYINRCSLFSILQFTRTSLFSNSVLLKWIWDLLICCTYDIIICKFLAFKKVHNFWKLHLCPMMYLSSLLLFPFWSLLQMPGACH